MNKKSSKGKESNFIHNYAQKLSPMRKRITQKIRNQISKAKTKMIFRRLETGGATSSVGTQDRDQHHLRGTIAERIGIRGVEVARMEDKSEWMMTIIELVKERMIGVRRIVMIGTEIGTDRITIEINIGKIVTEKAAIEKIAVMMIVVETNAIETTATEMTVIVRIVTRITDTASMVIQKGANTEPGMATNKTAMMTSEDGHDQDLGTGPRNEDEEWQGNAGR